MRYIGFSIILLSLLTGCSKPVDFDTLNVRDDLVYEQNHNRPYSGNAILYSSPHRHIETEMEIKKGTLHGEVIHYYDPFEYRDEFGHLPRRRLISLTENWRHGKLHGESRSYYLSGQRHGIANRRNGKLHGKYTAYHKNGQLKTKGRYKDDEKQGWWSTWREDGHENPREYYEGGTLTPRN
jgi:antitoxin component YwqK of YwqJK toxin-antitoxin module